MKSTTHKLLALLGVLFLLPMVASAATLSVSPASQSVKVGDTFNVSVRLDTQGASIDGVDLRYLSFNPTLLQVVDANPSQDGVQITADNLMALTVMNAVDNKKGQIGFSQVAAGGTKYKGSGILANISFKAVGKGTAALTFSYIPRNTTDTNVASGGTDILSAVINGSYTIAANGTQTTAAAPVVKGQPSTPSTPTTVENPSSPTQSTQPTDDTAFQYAPKKGFIQTLLEMIKNAFIDLKTRISNIF